MILILHFQNVLSQGEQILEIIEEWKQEDDADVTPTEAQHAVTEKVEDKTVLSLKVEENVLGRQDSEEELLLEGILEEMEQIELPKEFERMHKSKTGLNKGFLLSQGSSEKRK